MVGLFDVPLADTVVTIAADEIVRDMPNVVPVPETTLGNTSVCSPGLELDTVPVARTVTATTFPDAVITEDCVVPVPDTRVAAILV